MMNLMIGVKRRIKKKINIGLQEKKLKKFKKYITI
jgi:hypothetical protein